MNLIGSRGKFYDVTPTMVDDAIALARMTAVVAASAWAKILYLDLYLGSNQDVWPYLTVGIVAALLLQLVISVSGFTPSVRLAGATWRIIRTATLLALAFLLLIAVGYLLKIANDYSRGWMIAWYLSSVVAIGAIEFVGAAVRSRLARRGYFTRRIATYGDSAAAQTLASRLEGAPDSVMLAGYFSDRGDDRARPESGVSGGLEELVEACRAGLVDDVVLVGMGHQTDRISEILKVLGQLPVNIQLASDFISFNLDNPKFNKLGTANLVELQTKPLSGWSPWAKAVIDYTLGLVFLTLAAPLMILIAIAIKLDSPGAVFFRQRRHGFNNQAIDVIKFRSMYVGDNEQPGVVRQATKNDARVTRVGRILRSTSLDELPQLINVLRGEMSITGPRPHAVEHNLEYGRRIEQYASRHKIKPGITGWAQVNGYRGETDIPEKMRKRVEYDIYYIENWTVGFDLKIIFLRTIPALLSRQNAY